MPKPLYRSCWVLSGLLSATVFPLRAEEALCPQAWRTASNVLKDAPQGGIQILRQVLESKGCALDVQMLTGVIRRHHQMLQHGEIEVLVEAAVRPERQLYAWFSRPYRTEKILLLRRKNTPASAKVESIEDIAALKLKVLVADLAWYGPRVDFLRPEWRRLGLYVEDGKVEVSLRHLRDQRADLMIITDDVFTHLQAAYPELEALPVPVHMEPAHFMLSKRAISYERFLAFDAALEQWLKRGQKQVGKSEPDK